MLKYLKLSNKTFSVQKYPKLLSCNKNCHQFVLNPFKITLKKTCHANFFYEKSMISVFTMDSIYETVLKAFLLHGCRPG